MSYGQWTIDRDETINEFGYDPNLLTIGSKKPVKCICINCGIKANKRFREANRKHICQSIIDAKKKCFKCRLVKPVEEFSKNKATFDGYQKACKECYSNYLCVKNGQKKRSVKLKENLQFYLRNKTSHIQRKCKLKNIPFDLTKEFIYELYEKQNGRCYFTGIEIFHNSGCPQFDSISLERLNPDEGYVMKNVVLALFTINSFKGMMNEAEFKQFLIRVIPSLIEYSIK